MFSCKIESEVRHYDMHLRCSCLICRYINLYCSPEKRENNLVGWGWEGGWEGGGWGEGVTWG